jgi:hypothetical protein
MSTGLFLKVAHLDWIGHLHQDSVHIVKKFDFYLCHMVTALMLENC